MGSALIRENFASITKENHDEVVEKTRDEVLNMLKTTIRPEFLNRIDEIIMFEPLKENEIAEVVRIQLNGLVKTLKNNGVELEFTDEAVQLIAKMGYDPEFGARPVKRVIQRYVLDTLSKRLLAGTVDRSTPIRIDVKNGELDFKN
jgi:ATP-dependent Clp protease ATP-binding subunit ClpB